jgi:hypothetical protein
LKQRAAILFKAGVSPDYVAKPEEIGRGDTSSTPITRGWVGRDHFDPS